MRNDYGWWFPETESHFPRMLKKSVDKGGPSEYQHIVRNRSVAFCQQRRLAIDVGANVGLWTRSLVREFQQVIAFEPVAMFRECLSRNVTAPNLLVQTVALGDINTTARMNITEGNTGHTHIDPTSIGQGDTIVCTLDSFEYQNLDYIKLDCEGFEYKVLLGAVYTIKQNRPIVVLEQKPHDAYSDQYSQFAAIELLQSWGMVRLDQVKDDWIMGWS
jgi:FkbM family methyltransferase